MSYSGCDRMNCIELENGYPFLQKNLGSNPFLVLEANKYDGKYYDHPVKQYFLLC